MATELKNVWLRLSPEDKLKLQQNAQKARMSVSQYVMSLAENKPIFVIDDISKFMVQLKKIGSNLNQITNVINVQKYVDYPARRAVNDNQKELRKIAEMVNKILLNINCPSKRTLAENEKEWIEKLENIRELSASVIEKIRVDGNGDS